MTAVIIIIVSSRRHAHGRAAAAQERKEQQGAAPSPSQSSSPVVESLESVSRSVRRKEWKERERDGAQRIQRESADNMRRGQQAQPHGSHTTRRHPRKEGTQRQQPPTMQEEKTCTTISPSSSLQSLGNGKNPQPPHNAHGASEPSSIHNAAQVFLPSRPQWDTEPNSAQSHAVHHTHRKGDSGCALPLSLLLMATEEDNSHHTQLPACTAKGAFKSTAMCIFCVCVVVCACSNTKQRSGKEGAEYVERRTKMYSKDA
ncbi:hypothetical protein TcCL_Unassigned04681 [Trypanosoma cruzi]|uniref:Uncharacterized protein n=1 Tax=Trypanosoma cruzi TaxID=5693 RepID=A0A7J6XU44_TRYCR|nr:hypothetical protein ECC02_009116 [Trypanosoma cruzi]RNC32686.1 hypothetical protein TcCL_Unassigned04681 [Trypanosoma cruzi]